MMRHEQTVAVYVADLERALAFYTEILGFEARRAEALGTNTNWFEVALPGAEMSVLICPRSLAPDWKLRRTAVMFHCKDVAAAYRELSARGVTFMDPPRQMDWGMSAKFVDCDGNEFILTSETAAEGFYRTDSEVSHPAAGPSPL